MSDELTIDSGALIFATLADVYLSSGMIDEAISILKDGLSRNPTYTLAKVILGRAYYMKGDIDASVGVLEEAYEKAKQSESANLYLGHCYKQRGDIEKAATYYEAVLKINPDSTDAREELAALKSETMTQEPRAESQEPRTKIKEPRAEELEVQEPRTKIKEPRAEELEVQEPRAKEAEAIREETAAVLPLETLNEPIGKLLDIGTVTGAFICSKDGLLIQDYCENRRDVEEMSALIASIHNEAEQSSQFLKAGDVEKFIIEKGDETICVLVTVESLFTVITEPEAKPGLVFVYARKIIDEIKEILG